MRFTFLGLGFVFLMALALWIVLYAVSSGPAVEVTGKGFTEPTFTDTANAALTKAEATRDAIIGKIKLWNFLSQVAGWITLAASSIVTITAGMLGKPETGTAPAKRGATLYMIGGLSALASVGTLSGSYAKEIGQAASADAVEITRAIRKTAETLKADPGQETLLLSELDVARKIAER